MDKPVFKLINKAWISLLGPVDTEKFKNEFLIQNNYEINLNPEFSNFSNFEGVKKFQAFVNENPRDASLHIMISQAGFCLIILTFSITYEEFTKFDVIKIKTDEVVQGKPTAEFFFDIAEQIFDVQSFFLIHFRNSIKDNKFVSRLTSLGVQLTYNHIHMSMNTIISVEQSISEDQWTELKSRITLMGKDDSNLINYQIPRGIFEDFECEVFLHNFIFIKGPKRNVNDFLKVEMDIYRKATSLLYLNSELSILELELQEIIDYIDQKTISWLYVKNELNEKVSKLRKLVINLERTAYDKLGKSNVRTSSDEPYFEVFEKLNQFQLVKEEYETRKNRLDYLINDIRKDIELKIEQEENIGNTRLIQLFSLFAILEVIFGFLDILTPQRSELLLYTIATLVLIGLALIIVLFGSKYQVYNKEKEARSIGIKKKLTKQLTNLEYMKNQFSNLSSMKILSDEIMEKELLIIDETKEEMKRSIGKY